MGARIKFGAAVAAVLVVAAAIVGKTAAKTYVVGDSSGWTIPSGGAATYATWVSQYTFVVGDILVFNFPTGVHDVAEVDKTGFDSCSSTNPKTLATIGPANITLSAAGALYWICTFGRHCSLGQKLAINVATASASTPPPALAPRPTTAPSPPPPTSTPTPTAAPPASTPLAPSAPITPAPTPTAPPTGTPGVPAAAPTSSTPTSSPSTSPAPAPSSPGAPTPFGPFAPFSPPLPAFGPAGSSPATTPGAPSYAPTNGPSTSSTILIIFASIAIGIMWLG